jgi:hypothetical protein
MNRIEIERERLLGRLIGGLALAASVAYLPSVYFAFVEGLYALVAIDTLAYACVIAAANLRRMGFTAKLWTLILVCLALGLSVLVNTGAQGAGYIWLIGGMVLSALFGHPRITIATFVASFLLMVAYGAALAHGLDGRGLTVKTVAIIGSNLFVVCITLVLIIHRMLRSLEIAFDERIFLSDHLASELEESERTRRELSKASDEKGVLIQELHHRVNNNMQLMLSLIELEREDVGPCAKIRRRIKVLSAANEVVLWEENAAGARLVDIAGAVVDSAGELEDSVDRSERKRKRIVHPDTAASHRFIDSRTAIIFALCLSDLLETEVAGCEILRLEISEFGKASRVAAVFEESADPTLVEAAAGRLARSVLAEAAAGSVEYSYLPPADTKGASIAVDIPTEPRSS